MNVVERCTIESVADLEMVALKSVEKPAQKRRFIRGPLDAKWLETAAQLPGQALHVALALRYLDGFERTGTVRLKPTAVEAYGVSRHAKYRALKLLEAAGLITVKPSGRGSPKVVHLVPLA